jgi:hypothetical protein
MVPISFQLCMQSKMLSSQPLPFHGYPHITESQSPWLMGGLTIHFALIQQGHASFCDDLINAQYLLIHATCQGPSKLVGTPFVGNYLS